MILYSADGWENMQMHNLVLTYKIAAKSLPIFVILFGC